MRRSPAPYDLGVLFVHGIGDQARGATLVRFGGPLVSYLESRAEQLGGSAILQDAVIRPSVLRASEDAPAHAHLHINYNGKPRNWLLAESWWAESFAMPRYTDLVRWGFSILPWTLGAHYGRRLLRALRSRPAGPLRFDSQWAGSGARIVAALSALLGGLLLSVVGLATLAVILVLALIPWRSLRSALLRIQVQLASSLGDSYVLLHGRIEEAAILGRFRRDLQWLALEKGCRRIAVIAHSQGGAVATLGLENPPDPRIGLLVTFGSGLRKLEELRELHSQRSFRLGAGLTVVGLVVLLWAIVAAPHTLTDGTATDIAVLLGVASAGLAVVLAGIRDMVVGKEPQRLAALADAMNKYGIRWRDLYASHDPVPNGPLRDDENALPKSQEVVNSASMLGDHTGYWRNGDEFVGRVVDALLEYDEPPILPRLQSESLEFLATRRRARVLALRISKWVGIVALTALVISYGAEWWTVSAYLATLGMNTVTSIFGGSAVVTRQPAGAEWGAVLGWLAVVGSSQLAARGLWVRWERRATEEVPYAVGRRLDNAFAVAVMFQVILAGVALRGGQISHWDFILGLAFVLAVLLATSRDASDPPGELLKPATADSGSLSQAERMARVAIAILRFVFLVIFGPLAFLAVVNAARALIERMFAVSKPSWILGAIVVIAAVLLGSMLLVGILRIALAPRHRGEDARSAATDDLPVEEPGEPSDALRRGQRQAEEGERGRVSGGR